MSDARVVVVTSAPAEVARATVSARGLEVTAVIDRRAFMRSPLALRRDDAGVLIHSANWSRESTPQVYDLALAVGRSPRLVLDEHAATLTSVSSAAALAGAAASFVDVAVAGFRFLQEAAHFARVSKMLREAPQRAASNVTGLVAIWLGGSETVGGAVTHASGILRAFHDLGLEVGLVTAEPLPQQLGDVVDDVELLPPPDRAARLSADAGRLHMNRAVREATNRLTRRMAPAFVYQRHRAFLTAGAEAAARLRVPLVLEWNNSEVWTRRHCESTTPLKRVVDPLLAWSERAVLAHSSLVAAVSDQAAAMASAAGADRDLLLVVPNGVDLAEVARARQAVQGNPDRGLIGWIGSFGPWHGAPVLIQALALLPASARLLLIGDGSGRDECIALAKAIGVEARVEWAGSLPHDVALRRLAGCSVLASPHIDTPGHRFFGSPTKVFEYMAIGRPIVASRLEQIGELLADSVTARLVEPGDPRVLADALAWVLENPVEADRLGESARLEARARHSWAMRAASIVEAIACRGGEEPVDVVE